ncbi:unnamed protein product [Effrenium voratum]|uniref:DAGKc domain-containing protein n=1 Tax=Effrenium voratum TaxID=2562239 RepID=A0AA36MU56_9DINO|nr:unnamed protein product [Effrenium voratum]CAJ1418589.1 unnamed protein product [Effrenium voratum]
MDLAGAFHGAAYVASAHAQGVALAPEAVPRCGARKPPAELKFADLLGAVLEDGHLRFIHCPRGRSGCRVREDVVLEVSGERPAVEAWVKEVCDKCHANKSPRRYQVFVNPASGAGHAAGIWRKAKSLLAALPYLECQEVFTQWAGDAEERAARLELQSCDGIIVVSGDGMVHEVFNGLCQRLDASAALAQIAVGHIPAGSGNALAKSILEGAGEAYGVLDAAFLIAKGRTQALDLMRVQAEAMAGVGPRSSFLNFSGAIVADIDLGSEALRCLGGCRFQVWTALCLARPRALLADLWYLPPGAPLPAQAPQLEDELTAPWEKISGSFSLFFATNTAWACYDVHLAPGLALGGSGWRICLCRDFSRLRLTKCLLAMESGKHVAQEGVELLECQAFRVAPSGGEGRFSLDGEEVPFKPIQFWPSTPGRVLGAPEDLSESTGGARI